MKYVPFMGILAAILLIISCFLPWAYYPDIHQTFTGFYSNQNNYGKPGKVLIFLAAVSAVFLFIPKLWAKRINQFLAVLIVAYAIKSFVLFASCYPGICPQKKAGLWLMLLSAIILLACSLFSGVKLPEEKNK